MGTYVLTKTGFRITIFLVVAMFLIGILLSLWHRPKIYRYHADIIRSDNQFSGKVFKSSEGDFLVNLSSGSQLIVQTNPPKVFLSVIASPANVEIGGYLVVSSRLRRVDLSITEKFERELPVIGSNRIYLKDPMRQDSEFSFVQF